MKQRPFRNDSCWSAPTTQGSTVALRGLFLDARTRFNASLDALGESLDRAEPEALPSLWSRFEPDLLAHLERKEAFVFALADRVSTRQIQVLMHEHRHLRERLIEVSMAVRRGELRAARDFLEEVRAHVRSEARQLWARELASEVE